MNDESALAQRNSLMAQAFHTPALKHQLRQRVVETLAWLPDKPCQAPERERILLIRPDHLGDVLLTTPALHALRGARPEAELHALVGGWSSSVLGQYPEVDTVLTLDFPGFSRAPKTSGVAPYQLAYSTAQKLRRVRYSSAVIFRPDHWWGALVAKLAGIPIRIGYAVAGVTPFLTDALRFQHQHAVLQNAKLVERWTGSLASSQLLYRFPVNAADRAHIASLFDAQTPLICIHPGSGSSIKLWGENQWANVADQLAAERDAQIVFTGGTGEINLTQHIADQMERPAHILAGQTTVGQLAALFERARLVLGPDSGPLHLAAAVGTPTIALFGAADPVEFQPWGKPERHAVLTYAMACRPCRVLDWADDNPAYHPCVRNIPVARVLEAARRVMQS